MKTTYKLYTEKGDYLNQFSSYSDARDEMERINKNPNYKFKTKIEVNYE